MCVYLYVYMYAMPCIILMLCLSIENILYNSDMQLTTDIYRPKANNIVIIGGWVEEDMRNLNGATLIEKMVKRFTYFRRLC